MTAQAPQKNSYKGTLNLPQTSFPMEAKLTTNEPLRLAAWTEGRLYEKLLIHRAKSPKWILHDGPPFANGDIHIGHLINKTLKDVILRFRTMQGFQTPYVPGWDCHGLPIEHKIQQELGPKLRQMDVVEVRKLCYAYAEKYVGIQREQFQRLGILGEWNNPYLTMSPEYEAQTLEVFARFVEEGLVYKQLKPVPWSIENQTALADAELEYADVKDKSVYVLFEIEDPSILGSLVQLEEDVPLCLMVWTTTPWTLPANLAVAVNPESDYGLYTMTVGGERARGDGDHRPPAAADVLALELGNPPKVQASSIYFKGSDLAGVTYRHPFVDRIGKVVTADYVTLEDGTGLVHTAPGHGEDDYDTGIREKLEVYSPVLANGRFDDTVPEWLRGKSVWEANPLITEHLRKAKLLYHEQEITHSYPHDWRSKKPIIFRATEQWFIAIEKPFTPAGENDAPRSLRQRSLDCAMNKIEFIPKWGQARLIGMLESRPDWCVSRQRAGGCPFPFSITKRGTRCSRRNLCALSPKCSRKKAPTRGSPCLRGNCSGRILNIRRGSSPRISARKRIFSTSGSKAAAVGTPSCKIGLICISPRICILKARINIAAGSSSRCSLASAPPASRHTSKSSLTGSSSSRMAPRSANQTSLT